MSRYSYRPTFLKIAAGDRHGQLNALRPAASTRQGRVWLFSCDCGNQKELPIAKVIHGRNVSCGCKRHQLRGRKPKAPGEHRVKFVEKPIRTGLERYEVTVDGVVMAIAPTLQAAERSARTFGGEVRPAPQVERAVRRERAA